MKSAVAALALFLGFAQVLRAEVARIDTMRYTDGRRYLIDAGDTAYFQLYVQHKYNYVHLHDKLIRRTANLWSGSCSRLSPDNPGYILFATFQGRRKPTRIALSPITAGEKVRWTKLHLQTAQAARWMDSVNNTPGRFTRLNSNW